MANKIRKGTFFRSLTILTAILLILNGAALSVSAASSNSSVDHIDIGVSLTADIMIDGKLYENQTYTLQKSDLTASNLSITSSAGTHTYSLNRVSTSTGSSGIQQFRISGNFPVGTKASPVTYTVSLKKTVEVTTSSGSVSVPVTFTARFNYWDSHNDCPGLRGKDWQNGSVVRDSGMDFLLGNAKGDVNTKGTISIQKTLAGLTIPEGQSMTFTFDIYTASGTLYDTISATVGSTSPYASTSISEVPYGTYYVIERAAAVDGYTLSTGYTVGSSATTGKSADIVLSASAPSGAAYITNTYTALPPATTSVSVTKVWDNDTLSLRPMAVGVQLYQDGVAYGDVVALTEDMGWRYTWNDLSADSTWTVDEVRVPEGYHKHVTQDGNHFTITNTHEDPRAGMAHVIVNKVWNDNNNPDRPTQVTVQLYCNGEAYGDAVVLNAGNNWHYRWNRLNPDLTWTLGEVNVPEGYTSTITADGLYFTITNSSDYQPPQEPPTDPTTEPTTEPPTDPSTEPPTEPVPQSDDGMSDVPQTGQALTLWAALSLLSGAGLMKIALSHKREDEE